MDVESGILPDSSRRPATPLEKSATTKGERNYGQTLKQLYQMANDEKINLWCQAKAEAMDHLLFTNEVTSAKMRLRFYLWKRMRQMEYIESCEDFSEFESHDRMMQVYRNMIARQEVRKALLQALQIANSFMGLRLRAKGQILNF